MSTTRPGKNGSKAGAGLLPETTVERRQILDRRRAPILHTQKIEGNQSACAMHIHISELDSGFRRNDACRQAISWFVMQTKVGAFRYPGLFDDHAE